MAEPTLVALSPDRQQRSVWVVVDPMDLVTGRRVAAPLRVRLKDQPATPIGALSGVYCFTDLGLTAAKYTVQVEPVGAGRTQYFRAEREFDLAVVPVPGAALARNAVRIDLLPRAAYPFDAGATLARGRLVRESDRSALEGVRVSLIVDAVDHGLRAETDDRGEFAVVLPTPPPAPDNASGGLKTFTFRLRFAREGLPPHETGDEQVTEGRVASLTEIEVPGV